MLKKFTFVAFIATIGFASDLIFLNGIVKAHTEVFGDSTIDPESKIIESKLSMDENLESIKGKISVSLIDLKSDNEKRDEHMMETLGVDKYNRATFEVKSVTKSDKSYTLAGIMDLHGVKKEMEFSTNIKEDEGKVIMDGKGKILMSEFDITPPKLLFLSVRDQVDLAFDVTLVKK